MSMFLYNILEYDKFNNSIVIVEYRSVSQGGGLGYDFFDTSVGYIVELVFY